MGTFDVGDQCVNCGVDTAFGEGSFVNRIPAETDADNSCFAREAAARGDDTVTGYLCADCQALDCAECGGVIELGEEVLADNRAYCYTCWETRSAV